MLRLSNPLRDYAWGSTTTLQKITGRPVDGKPLAELWCGAHPQDPSLAQHPDGAMRLDDVISEDPHHLLGSRVVAEYGARLPYLVKFIAAAKPLSIQVHPNAEQAQAGFAAEDAAGVPVTARQRRYRDALPKPELIIALEPFTALVGLRSPAELAVELARVSDGIGGIEAFRAQVRAADAVGSWADALRWAVTDGGAEVDVPALARALSLLDSSASSPARSASYIATSFPADPGLLVAMMMHRVELAPGQGLYVPAGLLHTYLSGFGLEVMAASDNVLRAGLTSKHMDPDELLRLVHSQPGPLSLPTPQNVAAGLRWTSPAGFFEVVQVRPGTPTHDHRMVIGSGPRVAMVTHGAVTVSCDGARQDLRCGNAVFLPDQSGPLSVTGGGSLVVVGVPGFSEA